MTTPNKIIPMSLITPLVNLMSLTTLLSKFPAISKPSDPTISYLQRRAQKTTMRPLIQHKNNPLKLNKNQL